MTLLKIFYFISNYLQQDKLIITMGSQYLYKIISKISNKSNLNLCIKDEDYIDFNVRFLTLNIDNTLIKIKLHENPSIENELPLSSNKKNKTRFVMKSDDIHHLVKNMELISDHVKIKVELDQVHFYCIGEYAESHIYFQIISSLLKWIAFLSLYPS